MSSVRMLSVVLALALAGTAAAGASASLSKSTPGNTPLGGIAPGTGVGTLKSNWTQFRFNAGHTGVNPLEHTINVDNAAFLSLDWEAELGDPVFSSSPAVVGGVAYIASKDGTLWAYPADGCGATICTEPLWKSVSLGQIVDSPTVVNGVVYIGSQTSADLNFGKLNAFSAAGCGKAVCEPLWQGAAGKNAILESSPTVADGLVYIGAFDGRLYAFNAHGCNRALCQPTWIGTTGGTIESTPTVSNGVAYIGSDDGFLYAFAAGGCGKLTCQPLWRGQLGDPSLPSGVFESTPAVANGVVYIGSQHALAAFDATGCGSSFNCKPIWQSIDDFNFFGGSPAVAGGRVYIGLESNLAVFSADGCGDNLCTPLWLLTGPGAQASIESSPTIANGVVYAGRNTGDVFAWSAEPCGDFTCDPIWHGFINDVVVNSSPTVVRGKLYIGSGDTTFPAARQGSLYVFDLRE